MPWPSFTVTGDFLDVQDVVVFTSNVPAGALVTFEGVMRPVKPVIAKVNSSGALVTPKGDAVTLLANDDGLNVNGIQWTAKIGRLDAITFDAPNDGDTVDLESVVPSPSAPIIGLASAVAAVIVVTGNEARPSAALVLWIDTRESPTQPIHMISTDVWFAPNGEVLADETPPSKPTGLVASAITGSGFTVSWSASTDNVAVTGYEVRLDGGSPVSEATLSHAFSGLDGGTDYDVEVRAKDAAGNSSDWSDVLTVTTAESGVPPTTLFEFNESVGTTATSTDTLRTLTGTSGAVNGSGSAVKTMSGTVDTGGSLGTWTFSMVLTIDDVLGSDTSILQIGSSIFLNVLTDGKLRLYDTGTTTTASSVLSEDVQHRVTITSDGTNVKVYVDGTQVLIHATALPYDRAQNILILGGVGGSDLLASCNELGYWNTDLDASEVAEL